MTKMIIKPGGLGDEEPESWDCVDCGVNTAPGFPNRVELEKALGKITGKEEGVPVHVTDKCEMYYVRDSVWKAAGMEPMGGCLCVGCLEKRLGRKLKAKDFGDNPLDDPFNGFPGTPRLLERRRR
jgi:hypothetical protein